MNIIHTPKLAIKIDDRMEYEKCWPKVDQTKVFIELEYREAGHEQIQNDNLLDLIKYLLVP